MAKILIVEDEGVVARHIQEVVTTLGHLVAGWATSGTAALRIAAETLPDLVLMDIRLQGDLDGIAVAQMLYDRYRMPCVFMTAYADESILQRALLTAPFGYVVKPFGVTELQTSIAIALQRHQLEQHLSATAQQLTTTLSSIGDGTIAVDLEGCITFINPVAETLTGWSRQDAMGQTIQQVFQLHDVTTGAAIANPLIQAMQEQGQVSVPDGCVLRAKDGTERLIGDVAAPIRDRQGEITGSVVVFQDVTARKQVEATLRQHTERERLMGLIIQHLHRSLNLTEILQTMVTEVRQFLQVDRVLIYRFQADWSGWVVVESVEPPWRSLFGVRLQDPCFNPAECAEPFTRGKISAISDIETADLASCYRDLLHQCQVRANLVIPILTGQAPSAPAAVTKTPLWGLLTIQHCAAPRLWSEQEIELLQQLVVQVAIAIQQANLYAQVQVELNERKQVETALRQQADRERLMVSISRQIRQSLNLDEILDTTVHEVRRYLQTDRALLYRCTNGRRGLLVAAAAQPVWSIEQDLETHRTWTPSLLDDYEQGNTSVINAIPPPGVVSAKSTQFNPAFLQVAHRLQIQAQLAVPIYQGDRFWGVLVVHQCDRPRPWQAIEIEFLEQLVTQVGFAIQQSELYQQVQWLNSHLERQVQERTGQLRQMLEFEALLKRITDKVRDSLDERQIFQTAVQELAIGLDLLCCDMAIYDRELSVATVLYEYLPDAGIVAEPRAVPISTAPEVHAQIRLGQPIQFCLLPSMQTAVRPSNQNATVLACPLLDEQGVFGNLWLFKPPQSRFSDLEIRLGQQVANQCAIAVRQARLYQASQAQITELERLNVLKDDFLNTVSHELRTPLSSIKLATQMLEITLTNPAFLDLSNQLEAATQTSLTTWHSNATRYLKILKDECQREITLINDLLDLNRLGDASEPLLATSLHLQDLIPHITEPFQERARSQGQQLVLKLPEHLPPLITDRSYLQRILTELLNNACKYTPASGTITITVQMAEDATIANGADPTNPAQSAASNSTSDSSADSSPVAPGRNPPTSLLLIVSNSGIEIPGAELNRIFDKFYRIPNNDPWKYGGTGLGLALVKKLVERLGGTIVATSTAGQTTFSLWLPIELREQSWHS